MIMKTAYPQPDFARSEWHNLNGAWDFSYVPSGPIDDAPAYDLKIEVPYPWGSPLSGVAITEDRRAVVYEASSARASDTTELANGTGYYRRTASWNPVGERIFLCFGAVDYISTVTLNGKQLGRHVGGYARFDFEVTDIWDRTGENVIEVEAIDSTQYSPEKTFGKQNYGDARGIWQTVWLETRASAYVASFFVKTKLDGTVTYDVETDGAADGTIVTASFAGITTTAPVQDGKAFLSFKVENPKLWTPEEPNLYDGTLSVGNDTISTYFGIREVGTGIFGEHGRRYITLNGKPYYINAVLDQSFNPNGFFTLPTDDDCREEILRLKRIGINTTRIHIKAEEPLKLYWADKLGMLVIQDAPHFWSEPNEIARAQFERELDAQILRDRNHPSIFYWVVFNETWGLRSKVKQEDGTDAYLYTPETAAWVASCWEHVKAIDPTRLVEDNSNCNMDHTKTDVNTWHFYKNGYQIVKDEVEGFCRGADKWYYQGYTMDDVPLMNSECGNYWGCEGSAGESDISWQYKYMINEFRLQDQLCGFVFTEFHDVVNEFNGFYKLDNSDKDMGYDIYGMSLRDLHTQDYLGADHPPMKTVAAGASVDIPMFGSSFSDAHHGRVLDVVWQLNCMDAAYGAHPELCDMGEFSIVWKGYGTFPAGVIRTSMPEADCVAVLTWSLMDGDEIIMSNGLLFDVTAQRSDVLSIAPASCEAEGFVRAFAAQGGRKQNGLGKGAFTYTVNTAEIPGFDTASTVHILFEASTRISMRRDFPGDEQPLNDVMDYMMGAHVDPSENTNSFTQTDENRWPGSVEVSIDGTVIDVIALPDCPADSRGALSHHHQELDTRLDEAGTYGYLCDVQIPSALLFKLQEKPTFALTLRTGGAHGLSVFGRQSGRYAMDILIKAD